MSSSHKSSQRRVLKSLAKTPHSIYEDEDTPVIVEEATPKVTKKSTDNPVVPSVKGQVEDDTKMSETEYFQCGFCNNYHEQWIQCDNSVCPIQWYGLDCARLTKAPAGKWFCVLCRSRPLFPNLPGAPKSVGREESQEKVKGIARRTSDVKKTKPGWKGWVELSDDKKEKWQREVDKQWEVTALERRTRRGSEGQAHERTRRLRRGTRGISQEFQAIEEQEGERARTPEDSDEDLGATADDRLDQDPGEALSNQRRPHLSVSSVDSNNDEDMHEAEFNASNGETGQRWDRESTFEGFSDTEMTEDIESGLEELSVVDEEEVEEELSSSERLSDDEEEGPEGVSSLEQSSGVDEPREAAPQALTDEETTGEDVPDEEPRETLGVGADEYRYLDLSPYGPFLVRET